MPNRTPHPAEHAADDRARFVFDQVRDRVTAAETALAEVPATTGTALPTRALWRVFHDFGATYRQHRRQTGTQPLPAVRDAAHAFRRRPNLSTLVAVATVLDEHGLMTGSA